MAVQPSLFVIQLGLDLEFGTEKRGGRPRRTGYPSRSSTCGYCRRPDCLKNHELSSAIAHFKSVRALEPSATDVKFVVIGDGNLRSSLETMARSLGLEADVIFCGSRKDPEDFYAGLDVVALTSNNEGTPLTLIEAMANRVPVIATAVAA